MANYSVPGSDEFSGVEDRKALPGNEDYRGKVIEIKQQAKPNFEGKIIDVFTIKFDIVSFADGAPLEDIDGNKVESRWVWKDVDPTRMGFKQDGTASIARQFFLAANGIADLNAKVPSGDTEDLIGREVRLSLIVYLGKNDGKQKNRVIAIKPLTGRRSGAGSAEIQQSPTNTSPAVDPAYAAAVASLVNGTDTATSAQVAEISERLGS
jgi:hypothetical protein